MSRDHAKGGEGSQARTWIRRALFGKSLPDGRAPRGIGWGAAAHGAVLGAWYFIRPIRDEIAAHQSTSLTQLTTATFIVMLVAMPLYAMLVKRSTRRRLALRTYGLFAAMLVGFAAALSASPATAQTVIEQAFFVWSSVFNLFIVAVFWGFVVDLFSEQQGKRYFGVIAAGGSAGGVLCSGAASVLLDPPAALHWLKLSSSMMLVVGAAILLAAAFGIRAIDRARDPSEPTPRRAAPGDERGPAAGPDADKPISGPIWASLLAPFRSAYLLGLSGYLFLYTLTSTFLYFAQTQIVSQAITDRAQRAALFATMDFVVNLATLVGQLFFASRSMAALGVGGTLCIVPALTAAGFLVLARAPAVTAVVAFQVVRRTATFAFARPAREVLFTVVSRDDKYKAKSFIDTVVYRAGDSVSAWAYSALQGLELAVSGITLVAAGLSSAWLAVAWLLGRGHDRLTRARP